MSKQSLPDPVEVHIYLMMDENGDYAACGESDQISEAAAEANLMEGYRVATLRVSMRPPAAAEIAMEVPDDVPGAVPDEVPADIEGKHNG
jgi:hypothetical protein